jgi:hypothetical protein
VRAWQMQQRKAVHVHAASPVRGQRDLHCRRSTDGPVSVIELITAANEVPAAFGA